METAGTFLYCPQKEKGSRRFLRGYLVSFFSLEGVLQKLGAEWERERGKAFCMPDLYLCGDYILPGHQGRGERKKEEMSQQVSQTASESESENELGSKRRSEPMIS